MVKTKASVISFGPKLKAMQRVIWEKIESNAFKDDPNFLPRTLEPYFVPKRKSEKEEFFVLSIAGNGGRIGDYVGRAKATVDKDLIERGENVGFIDDFVIAEDYKDEASLLINRCISSLKGRGEGIKEVTVRVSQMFPVIETEGYEHTPPFSLPHNPPWLADIFLKNGFSKIDEYTFFHVKLPEITETENEAKKFEETLQRLGIEIRPLNRKNPLELAQFQRLCYETNPYSLRFNPLPIKKISRSAAFFDHLIFSRLLKYKTFIGVDKKDPSKMVLFMGYYPDFNQAFKSLNIRGDSPAMILLPFKLPFAIRKVKSCRELGIGLKVPVPISSYASSTSSSNYFSSYSKVCQKLGIGPAEEVSEDINMKDLFMYFVYLIRKDGYEEITAGVQTSDVHVQEQKHNLQNFITKYADNVFSTFKYASFVLRI